MIFLYNIAIDFGTTNTMIGAYNIESKEFSMFNKAKLSKDLGKYKAIASLIAYYPDGKYRIGSETAKTTNEQRIFSRMKLYLTNNNLKSIKRKIGQQTYDHRQAGKDYLSLIISLIIIEYGQENINKFIVTAPVNSFDDYRVLLAEICEGKNIHNYMILDESTAVALGYDAVVSPDYPYMIIDFGGGTLDISIVRINNVTKPHKVDVFGKSGANTGGENINNWLLEDFLAKNNLTLNEIKAIKPKLMLLLEELKLDLSKNDSANFEIDQEKDDYTISYQLSRDEFENLLKARNLHFIFQDTIDSAVGAAIQKGINKRDIKKVFLVGGSSQIPFIIDLVKLNFGDRVECKEPFSAVINGACKFISGTVIEDFLHHDYCLKYFNKKVGLYDYEVIVPQKTKFPTDNICQRIISSAFHGQEELELCFYEVLSNVFQNEEVKDITYDETGNLIAIMENKEEFSNKKIVPLNNNKEYFLKLVPPGKGEEPRIKLTFHVNQNRILLLDAIDLITGKVYYDKIEIARLK